MEPLNANDPLQTTDGASPNPPASTDAPPEIPGYTIESVLGRGGMGVVYKAHHLSLKRTVALKMILAGGHANEQDLLRFRAEVQAVARLQHPGIVQIHEVGDHDGHPFCALEFVEGGSLAQKLNGQPLPPRDAVRLVEALARAMHLAHSRNVVHRDLKPANVLLTKEGWPKVTDFGLARQLDGDSGVTQAGMVMGTPSYMAPEQASGQANTAGPAADVYALGAILYECLTGRPPFLGQTMLETLELVRYQEPVSPRYLQPQVPRDLETVCLHCLHKEPERRYPSAAELADELGRFQRGEPVLVRPVSSLERGWRWCRRKPALALALAAAVVFLIAGAAGILWFADEANQQADQARQRELEVLAASKREQEANRALLKKNSELERSQDRLEGTLARTWLSPLLQQSGPLTEPEIGALKQVAAQRGQPLALRFIRGGLTDPASMPGFLARAEYAWHAALGLDRRQRADAERLLMTELRRSRGKARQDLALIAVTVGERPLVATAIPHLTATLDSTTDTEQLQKLQKNLSAVAARLEPREAATVADSLSRAITRTQNPIALQSLAQALTAVAERMEPKEAAATLTQAMTRTTKTEPIPLSILASGLKKIADRLESKEAAAVVSILSQAMDKTALPEVLMSLAMGLTAMADRLEPREAAAVAGALTRAMSQKANPIVLTGLTEGLARVARRMEPKEAARVCARAAPLLTKFMTETANQFLLMMLAQNLAALGDRMEPREAAPVCGQAATQLIQAMANYTDLLSLNWLAEGLVVLADRMEPREAVRVCSQAATRLSQAMTKTSADDAFALPPPVEGLAALAKRMEPKEAAKVCGPAAARFINHVTKIEEPIQMLAPNAAKGLTALVKQMDPKEAAILLTQAMTERGTPFGQSSVARVLATVADRMEPREAARVCRQAANRLLQTMPQTKPSGLKVLAEGLAALAGRMESREAAQVCGQAANRLTQAMTGNTTLLPGLAEGLAALADGMEPREAAQVCGQAANRLTQAMTGSTDLLTTLQPLAEGLTAVASRMEPQKAAAVYRRVAASLIQSPTNMNWKTTQTLSAALCCEYSGDSRKRLIAVTNTVAELSGPGSSLAAPGMLSFALKPLPAPLPVQTLVDFLREPLCVGEVRRLVLAQLARHYQRSFADQWEFARFAEERRLGLDLLGPPPRLAAPGLGKN